MIDLTLEERQMIKDFIQTSLQGVSDTLLVDTFVLLLGGDPTIRKQIALQIAQYMDGQIQEINGAIASLDAQKADRELLLTDQLTKFSDLKTKLEAV